MSFERHKGKILESVGSQTMASGYLIPDRGLRRFMIHTASFGKVLWGVQGVNCLYSGNIAR
jgi:hypothetical protein